MVKIRTEKLKAEERLAAIGETAGMVGHDIRNLLQAIAGELYLAKTEVDTLPDGENKENLNESFTSIGRQLRYINKVVSDLLDYSKPMAPIMEEVDIEKTKEILLGAAVPDDIKGDVVSELPLTLRLALLASVLLALELKDLFRKLPTNCQ